MPGLEKRSAEFKIESDLLKELGERLVSEPEVALTELVKNAYDADSTNCTVFMSSESIELIDNGLGMTEDDFNHKWMTVATSNKLSTRKTKKYNRPVTGSKGIGRFAVRFLGNQLKLTTIAYDSRKGKKTKLIANFNWKKLDQQVDLTRLKIPYSIETVEDEEIGTSLLITDLKEEINDATITNVKTGSLGIESPLYSLIDGAPKKLKQLGGSPEESDPGFSLKFGSAESANTESLSKNILKNYIFRATVEIYDNETQVTVYSSNENLVYKNRFNINNTLNTNAYADIYWFPRRSGIFQGKGFDGKKAWTWIRNNSGIAIYDNGFRVRPYGAEGNDWLMLDHDASRNRRRWRTEWAENEFPMSQEALESPKLNPMLKLSTSSQVVGSVFVASNPVGNSEALSPNMDRQGFIENSGYIFLRDAIRFAVEAIAHLDKKNQLEEEERVRERKYSEVKTELGSVISDIEKSPNLSFEDKERLVNHYTKISSDVNTLEEYDRKAREDLEAMSLLGVVAGFMTHEFEAALMELEQASNLLGRLTKENPDFTKYKENIDSVVEYFVGYVSYTRLFIGNLQSTSEPKPVDVLAAVNYVLETFSRFQNERSIEVDVSGIELMLTGPKIPVAIYHGIFHNIYTNSLKALLSHSGKKIIKIIAWNEGKNRHILEVMDTGPGIPPNSYRRIWDPMYTTTSSQDNPLGSGMGLGLPLVKKVVEGQGGKIYLHEPPPGYSTCFRIELPINTN